MRLILQSQAAECSLACLVMVADHHDMRLDLDDVRRRFATSLKGSNMSTLASQASALGLQPRALQLELSELGELKLPCVLHWGMNHAVVLKAVHGGWGFLGLGRLVRGLRSLFGSNQSGAVHSGITILDPAVGERRVPIAQVAEQFTGVALELLPTAEFKAADLRQRVALSQLTGRVTGLSRSLMQIFAIAVVLQMFAITAPMFNQVVVDEVLTSGDRDLLVVLAVGFAMLAVIQTLLGLARSWMVMVLGQSVSLQWTGNVFAHLIRLPASYFESRHLGDISSRFGSVGAMQGTLTTAAVEALLDGIMAIAALAMMMIYAPSLAWVTIGGVALYALVRAIGYRPFRDASAERLVIAAKENSHFLETLRAIQPLKLFGREAERAARWQNLRVDVQNRDVRTNKLGIWFGVANSTISSLMGIGTFYLGAQMVMGGVNQPSPFTVGMLFAFTSYQGQFTGRVMGLINYFVSLRMLSLHSERLGDIVLTQPERDGSGESTMNVQANDLSHVSASIELKGVSFRYGAGEQWVLKDLNLKVEAGDSVAIVGPSGCGKSTLLKVMLGLVEPTAGEVLFGGLPMRSLGMANVRRKIGTVTQDDVLLTGSVLDNITFFDLSPNAMRAEACARLAQVHGEISRMPMGYQTLVGDLGSGISGGQKQRLLLARAMYKAPKVLALDEATSHLDVANERAVTAALARMKLTRIIIAHRPETIAGAQRVVQLRGGQAIDVVRSVPVRCTPRVSNTHSNKLNHSADVIY